MISPVNRIPSSSVTTKPVTQTNATTKRKQEVEQFDSKIHQERLARIVFSAIDKSSYWNNYQPDNKINLRDITQFEAKVKRAEVTLKKYDGTNFSKEELQQQIGFMREATNKYGGKDENLNDWTELGDALVDKSLTTKLK